MSSHPLLFIVPSLLLVLLLTCCRVTPAFAYATCNLDCVTNTCVDATLDAGSTSTVSATSACPSGMFAQLMKLGIMSRDETRAYFGDSTFTFRTYNPTALTSYPTDSSASGMVYQCLSKSTPVGQAGDTRINTDIKCENDLWPCNIKFYAATLCYSYNWRVVSMWSSCAGACGATGSQSRTVICEEKKGTALSNLATNTVDNSLCANTANGAGAQLGTTQSCTMPTCAAMCASTNCGSHGSCSSSTGLCVCSGGYTGTLCDTPSCASISCGAHGTCSGGVCTCSGGWSGTLCTVDPCANLNCGTHGTCSSGVCVCSGGYTGALCATAPSTSCAGVNCGAYGTCSSGVCFCTSGYTGTLCSTYDASVWYGTYSDTSGCDHTLCCCGDTLTIVSVSSAQITFRETVSGVCAPNMMTATVTKPTSNTLDVPPYTSAGLTVVRGNDGSVYIGKLAVPQCAARYAIVATNQEKATSKLSTGAIIGIAVGGGCILILLIITVIWCMRRINRKQVAVQYSPDPHMQTQTKPQMQQYQMHTQSHVQVQMQPIPAQHVPVYPSMQTQQVPVYQNLMQPVPYAASTQPMPEGQQIPIEQMQSQPQLQIQQPEMYQ